MSEKTTAVLLADGFEEVEAIAPIDVLRRAGVKVITAGVPNKNIMGSHGIPVTADTTVDTISADAIDMLVLPGGLKGTQNLEASEAVQSLIDDCVKSDKLIAAICAAPSIFAHKGLLKGREATVYPTFSEDLVNGGAKLSENYVCKDGDIITARGMGVAVEFGLKLAEVLVSPEKAEEIKNSIQMK